ncbi:MAG: nucleotidyltransferase family protein [Thermodesulfovibrionia bacterium]|nr:nucleotidyltransferase family protein [Thermodesulfovibrionia bacterium]
MGKNFTIKDILRILKDNKITLSEKYGVTDIAVFGSYVRNEHKGKSDIDIFVELKPGFRTFDNFMDLKFYLQKVTSKKIDLVVKDSIRQELKPAIFKEAVHA